MSPRPKRRLSTSDFSEKIIAAAWKQIAVEGAPALSLRSIARALSITAPAIYNYFPDRDGLVTALIIDAFTSLGDNQQQVLLGIPEMNHAERLQALGLAYRDWAVKFPERYQLIFGTPIAGYIASVDQTMPAAARSLSYLVSVLDQAEKSGSLSSKYACKYSVDLAGMFSKWQEYLKKDINHDVLYLVLVIWAKVHGLVSLEISNQFPPFIYDITEIFESEMKNLITQIIRSDS
ncbi:MAG: TetR family transcriptional regulator [Chloroflexi bacterium HGW-Chloroflexi-3]|nr:MAG: TetR family transcriptional regulator [Chloroflexi bacterium HGW-Chloroflexi-3]